MPAFDDKTWELLKAMFLMAIVLAIVALGIQLITVYRRRLTRPSSDSREEQAELFREAYESGEIDTDEYRQIKDALDRGQAPPPLKIAGHSRLKTASGTDVGEHPGTAPRHAGTTPTSDHADERASKDEGPDLPRSE
ncbi:hypothetical protein AB1L88_00575 [Tautonia sp. JC769]|uniref:hypothetical protein n=1 Tax=Tautonia sp. JC769 TaxID=3232135 RepID=UPI00345AEEF9